MKALFLGDICPTDASADYFEKGDIEFLFGDTAALFSAAEFRMANLECALTDSETEIDKFGPCLKAPTASAATLRTLGVDAVSLSNNHVFDFGKAGIRDTKAALDAAGIAYSGFGEHYEDSRRDLLIEKNGERIAVLCVCEHEYSYALENRMGSRPFDEFDTMLDIRRAKASADRVIVLYHGGKEHCRYPSPRLYKACHAMAEHGADLILCQHSHCVGCYEEYKGTHILYGQGNFHFFLKHGNSPECWLNGLAVTYDTVSGEIGFIPVMQKESGRIAIARDADAAEILNPFRSRSAELLNGKWRDGWHDFCLGMEESYTRILQNSFREDSTARQNHKFAHYLDCEAHTDVWRELFPTKNHTNEL